MQRGMVTFMVSYPLTCSIGDQTPRRTLCSTLSCDRYGQRYSDTFRLSSLKSSSNTTTHGPAQNDLQMPRFVPYSPATNPVSWWPRREPRIGVIFGVREQRIMAPLQLSFFHQDYMCCLTKEITPCFLCYHLPPSSPPDVLIVYIQWRVGGKMAFFRWSKLIAMQHCELNLTPERKLSSNAKISCNDTPQILTSLSVAFLAKDLAE